MSSGYGSQQQSKAAADNSNTTTMQSESKSVDGSGSEGQAAPLSVSSDEVNYLVFRYLQESGFVHSAFTFAHESMLGRTGLRSADKTLPPGALVTFLQKGLQYVGIEENLQEEDNPKKGGPTADDVDFSLLAPATITSITRRHPPIQLNVPPATAAAAVKARLEAEAKLQAEQNAVAVSNHLTANGPLMGPATAAAATATAAAHPVVPPAAAAAALMEDPNTALARQALAAQAAAARAAAAMSQLHQMGQPPPVASAAAADAFAQQQRVASAAADIMALQQQQKAFAPTVAAGQQQQPQSVEALDTIKAASALASAAAQGGKRAAAAAVLSTNANHDSRKQKKPKIDDEKTSMEAERGEVKGGPSRAVAPEEKKLGDVSQKDTVPDRRETAPMEIDDNDQQGQRRAAEPAHKDQNAQQLPSRNFINGEIDRNGNNVHPLPNNGEALQQQQQAQPAENAPPPLPSSVVVDADPEDRDTAASSDEVLILQAHESEVFMCAWNPVYTNLIATGSGDASARIWDVVGTNAKAGLRSVKLLPHGADSADKKNKDVTTLEWSPDGESLATGSYDGVARVWGRNGALLFILRKHTGPIFSLKWNKRGNFILSGSYDKTAIVWDVSDSKPDPVVQQFTDHEAPTLDVDWKDDTTFASCSTDKTVHICRVGEAHPLKVYKGHKDEVNAVKWDPSGSLLASCSDDCTAKVWQVDSDRTDPLYDFTSHRQEIYTVKWSPTGPGSANPSKSSVLATASFDGTVRLWNMTDGSCYRVFSRHRDSVYSVSFSPSGDFLASGSLAGQMYIWNIEESRHVKSYKGKGDIFEVAWNAEETRVAACFSSNVVAVIDFDRNAVR